MRNLRKLHCSFCGRSAAEVNKLVAGPRVHICDKCAAIAHEIMKGPPPEKTMTGARLRSR